MSKCTYKDCDRETVYGGRCQKHVPDLFKDISLHGTKAPKECPNCKGWGVENKADNITCTECGGIGFVDSAPKKKKTPSTPPSKAPLRESQEGVLDSFRRQLISLDSKRVDEGEKYGYEEALRRLEAIAQSHADSQVREALERVYEGIRKKEFSLDGDTTWNAEQCMAVVDQELSKLEEK